MLFSVVMIALGVGLLFWGAEWLVKGAAQLALSLGIPPLVVGLTVVSFATSMPEAVASLMAQLVYGQGDMAVGNVVGSNMANTGLILGSTCLLYPIRCCPSVAGREIPILMGVMGVVALIFWYGAVTPIIGMLLLFALGGYVTFHVLTSRNVEVEAEKATVSTDLMWIGAGSVMLVIGGYCLVDGAVSLMEAFGVSARVIGLTVVAFGTSCPELAASLLAAWRRHSDIAIGNVIGSNIFNMLFILGLVGSFGGVNVEWRFLTFDLPFLAIVTAALWAMVAKDHAVNRLEGALLLGSYTGYIGWILS